MTEPYSDNLTPDAPLWFRLLDRLESMSGRTWPWGGIWLWRGFAFHFANGFYGGFALTVPLPRMLPGFVKDYQVQELRTRAGRRESDLHLHIPIFPPGKPHTGRTRRLRVRR